MGHFGSLQLGFGLAAIAMVAALPVTLVADERTSRATATLGKGDRLAAVGSSAASRLPERAMVATIEVVGVSEAEVVLRDRAGAVLYRSDPVSNTTLAARNADLPQVTVKLSPSSAVSSRPVPVEAPPATPPRKMPVGCEAVLSGLVGSSAARTPTRCLASATAGTRA